jgi:hypothetical protein
MTAAYVGAPELGEEREVLTQLAAGIARLTQRAKGLHEPEAVFGELHSELVAVLVDAASLPLPSAEPLTDELRVAYARTAARMRRLIAQLESRVERLAGTEERTHLDACAE